MQRFPWQFTQAGAIQFRVEACAESKTAAEKAKLKAAGLHFQRLGLPE
jgi:hypothetical protein